MGSLFGGKSKTPPPPPPKPIAPLPDEESPQVKEAGRRRLASILGRSGRQNSILSQADEDEGIYGKGPMGG